MKGIMLVLTQNCNLACRYCYEQKGGHVMTFDTARRILDAEIGASAEHSFRIFFFGGEPFLNFRVMQQIVSYLEQHYGDREITYAVTTNGTRIHGELQDWLRSYRDRFEVTLSLDGTRAMHDRNRLTRSGRGSYGLIDLPFFIQDLKHCIVKMTISPETLPDFAAGIQAIEQAGLICKANFASGACYDLEHSMPDILRNMEQLAAYYKKNDRPLCYMLDLDLKSILKPLDMSFRYCGAGLTRHCYDAEANDWYPCQGLMPMATGGDYRREDFSGSCILEASSCRTCPWIRICRTCYAANRSASGNVYEPDRQLCQLNQLCMLTSARIQFQRMKRSGEKDPLLAAAICRIAGALEGRFYPD